MELVACTTAATNSRRNETKDFIAGRAGGTSIELLRNQLILTRSGRDSSLLLRMGGGGKGTRELDVVVWFHV